MTTDTLYDQDFVTWTERQAKALRDAARQGSNLPLDWDNLAEEIEDLGNEVRNKIGSLTRQIQIHLLKIACSAADEPRRHWIDEVDEFRNQLSDQLKTNHALRARFADIAHEEFTRSVKQVDRGFRRHGEPGAALDQLLAWKRRGITAAEVLEDGLYPEPGTLAFTKIPD